MSGKKTLDAKPATIVTASSVPVTPARGRLAMTTGNAAS